MPNPDAGRDRALAGMLGKAYLEIIPTSTILERVVHLPQHAYVAITCSPVHGIEPTLALTAQLRALPEERRLKLIPHIAARMVRDRGHLQEILARLDELRVESVFIPGGDAPVPAGAYHGALDLLRDMAEIGHGIEDIGVAAHPEGHPHADEAESLRLLRAKQPLATYLVTQMCFDSEILFAWLRRQRAAGVTLPAWIGLPGVTDVARLLALSLRIGVGQSVKALSKQKGLAAKLFGIRPYEPNELLQGIHAHLDDATLNVPGFHLFSFNSVEATERWRQATLRRLEMAEEAAHG